MYFYVMRQTGFALDLMRDISMQDPTPVRQTYRSIPNALYSEVKDYIHDLLSKGFIRKSKSAFASPLVCVRKKDGSVRLCRPQEDKPTVSG